MAITILGGLTTATFLNLAVLPEALIRMQGWLGLGKRGQVSKPVKAAAKVTGCSPRQERLTAAAPVTMS